MFLDQCDKIPLCVTAERGNTEIRVGRDKMRWLAMQVCKVAPAAAGHQYFLACLVRPFEHNDAAPTITRRNGAHEAGGATAQDNYIVFIHGGNIAGEAALQRKIRKRFFRFPEGESR